MMEKIPTIIKGNSHTDERGTITYNNDYDASEIKRIYFIENKDTDFVRGWQGHKVEQRWFSAVQGSFKITTIAIDDWEKPSQTLEQVEHVLQATSFDVLHVPQGFITSIQALEENAKLMALSDYNLGTIKDEYRFDSNHFKK
ncbi:WxcM-like domain-containing protein [uncultured Flavobacterium sp.]|uniref:WxcM-like domain-containing protein n=1 Tax=uncultured Flavobacterium sp. TaxID=165435 RepID=UPI0030EEF427